MSREEAKAIISQLSMDIKQALKVFVETADAQGDYHYDDDAGGSMFEDDVQKTLNHLACEIVNS